MTLGLLLFIMKTLSITMLCHYSEGRILFIIMLNVHVLSVFMLTVLMLSVIMRIVVAPQYERTLFQQQLVCSCAKKIRGMRFKKESAPIKIFFPILNS